MEEVNVVIRILLQLHAEGDLEIVRSKDRFLQAPSGGGWRDIMINVCLTHSNGVKHICEIQVVHHLMLNARKEMAGHAVYNVVRNGLEMLSKRRGSVDVTALADFDPNLEAPKFNNWHTDEPANEWEGVISCSPQDEIWEVDIAVLDPDLLVRHRMPNLRKLAFPTSVPKLHLPYVNQVQSLFYSFEFGYVR
jgi:hypothetical protein